jgi:putative SbcD/Mre11-related phosphoesterase
MSVKPRTPPYEAGHPLVEGWQFTPEGAAVHCGERTAVIADVHLGYEWARGSSGDCVVEHSLHETLTRLQSVFERMTLSRLIVAGDLLESHRPCQRTTEDLRRLTAWLADRGVNLLVLEGNHDVSGYRSVKTASRASNPLPRACTIAGWTIAHGHRRLTGPNRISGHHHPVFRFRGNSARCFLVGPGRIVLPAFSSDAAGCDVVSAAVPREWLAGSLHCLVSTGDDMLDFGPLTSLRRRLRSSIR